MRNTLCEQMFSASPPNSDIPRCDWHFAFVPKGDIFWLRNWRRRRQSCPELGLDQSENLLDRRGRRYVKGFIENLTQLVGAID